MDYIWTKQQITHSTLPDPEPPWPGAEVVQVVPYYRSHTGDFLFVLWRGDRPEETEEEAEEGLPTGLDEELDPEDGPHGADLVMEHYETRKLHDLLLLEEGELLAVEGVGPARARAFESWLASELEKRA